MRKSNLIAAILLVIFTILAVSSIWPDRKSPTCDELAHHIPPGYVFLTKGDLKMATDSPPLARYLVALPLKLFMEVNMPEDREEWRRPDRAAFGKDFFYKYNNQPHLMIFLARLPIVFIGILCGLALYIWVKMMYGERIALLSLFFYSFSPNILAHSRLATTDMVATCFILMAIFTFWLFINKKTLGYIILSGICLGLAQLSKYTSLLLYPLFILLFAFEYKNIPIALRRNTTLKLFIIFVVSFLILWAGYGFDSSPILKDAMRAEEKLQIAHSIAGKVIPAWNESLSNKLDNFLLKTPFPGGIHVLGVLGVVRHGYEGHGTFFCGKWSSYGNPLYYLLAFLIKTPIPTIVCLFSGIWVAFKEKITRNERFILISILIFFLAGTFSKLQLGLRYILPIYPLCFIIAGRGMEGISKRLHKIPVLVLIIWYVGSSLWIWPDYLSYFNEFIGGPKNGYKYLRDSNIDWGQDLPALAKYMEDNDIKQIRFHYFGTADPVSYGINYEKLTKTQKENPQKGVYALSVHKIDAVKWAKSYEPTARLGNSIFIYDLR